MKQRTSVLSAIALAVSALLVSIAGAAYADNLVVDGDALVTGTQAEIDFGTVACGATATEQVAIYVQRVGQGQVFQGGALVDVTATTSAPLSVSGPIDGAEDIKLPSNWTTTYPNNTLSTDGVAATVRLTAGTTAGSFSRSIEFSGAGAALQEKPQDPASMTRSVTVTARWTVIDCQTPSTTTVTCPTSVPYSGSAVTPCQATVTGTNNFSQSVPVTYTANTNVGTVTASAQFAGTAAHKPSSGSTDFTITKASSTTTLACPASVAFTGSALTPCTAAVSGPGLSTSVTPRYTDNTNSGTATASAAFAGDANHTGSADTKTFEIDPAQATCDISGFTGDYDGNPHGAKGSCIGLGGADVSAALNLGASYTNVPGGQANWSFELPNYVRQTGSVSIAIGKATSSIELQCSDTVYNGAAQETCTATVTGAGGLAEPVDVEYAANTGAGTATATATYAGDDNHEGDLASTNFEIAKAPTTTKVTCTGPNTYTGAALTPCTAEVTAAYGLVATPTPSYANNTNAGTASASYTYAGDANHEPSSDSMTFTVDKASSSITLSCPVSVVFTGDAHEPCTAVVSAVGLVDFTIDVVHTDNTDAGNATATAAWAGDPNHVGSSANGGFEIRKAPSEVVVSCPTTPIPFTGSPIEPCSASVTGAGGLDQPVSPVTYSDNTLAGTATASATYAGDANHLAGGGSASFTIEAWKLNGFYKPVDVGTAVLNIVKGGSTVPLKFMVLAGTTEVTELAKLGADFVVKGASCDPADPTSDDLLTTTGNTTLRYDATTHQWIQNWQTPKTAGKCYTVVLKTADGSTLKAQFKTK